MCKNAILYARTSANNIIIYYRIFLHIILCSGSEIQTFLYCAAIGPLILPAVDYNSYIILYTCVGL